MTGEKQVSLDQDKLSNKDYKDKIKESDSIKKTAEDLLGYNDNKINIFGNAYKSESI